MACVTNHPLFRTVFHQIETDSVSTLFFWRCLTGITSVTRLLLCVSGNERLRNVTASSEYSEKFRAERSCLDSRVNDDNQGGFGTCVECVFPRYYVKSPLRVLKPFFRILKPFYIQATFFQLTRDGRHFF